MTNLRIGSKFGKPAIPLLITAMSRPEKSVAKTSVEALGKIRDYHAISPLEKILLTHDESEIQMEAGIALGRIGDKKIKKILYKVVKNTNRWDRLVAALIGLVCSNDTIAKNFVFDIIANGGLYKDNKAVDDAARVHLVMGLALIRDTDGLQVIYEFKEKLILENSKQSLQYAEAVSTFANVLEDILHPKKDPEQEEFELQNKKLDEEHERLMGSN